ncbi:hypothetical protein GCM10023225_24000 [Kineococcus glutinatus]|uniref:Uncharacterized protein n=1 Tax=Kineococcus glutinatus TaxID=1070872 RepID=A0ABP9I088_9ACTN
MRHAQEGEDGEEQHVHPRPPGGGPGIEVVGVAQADAGQDEGGQPDGEREAPALARLARPGGGSGEGSGDGGDHPPILALSGWAVASP